MGDLINSINQPETAMAAAVGCATGFVWGALAGEADISEGEGLLAASYSCLGSAINAAGVYGISRYATQNPDTAAKITTAWFGVQSAASFTNMLGVQNGWQGDLLFNAVALPLNFTAAPLASTLGLLQAGFGEMEMGFSGQVRVFGGSLIFRHELCALGNPTAAAQQLGAIGHYCAKKITLRGSFHELGHMAHFSVMGDLGGALLYALNALAIAPFSSNIHDDMIEERWADDYSEAAAANYRLADPFVGRKFAALRRRTESIEPAEQAKQNVSWRSQISAPSLVKNLPI